MNKIKINNKINNYGHDIHPSSLNIKKKIKHKS